MIFENVEQDTFPKQIVTEETPGVSIGIKAKRCEKCEKVVFTNIHDFVNCRDCKK